MRRYAFWVIHKVMKCQKRISYPSEIDIIAVFLTFFSTFSSYVNSVLRLIDCVFRYRYVSRFIRETCFCVCSVQIYVAKVITGQMVIYFVDGMLQRNVTEKWFVVSLQLYDIIFQIEFFES